MSNNDLTKEQKKILKELSKDMMELATEVVDSYELVPVDTSGSGVIVQIHENSPFLEEKSDDTK